MLLTSDLENFDTLVLNITEMLFIENLYMWHLGLGIQWNHQQYHKIHEWYELTYDVGYNHYVN